MNITEDLRVVMRQWATGVAIVAAAFDGRYHGMTVNSFTSISLEPPLVLVSLWHTSRTRAMVQNAGYFGVTILAHDQVEISNRFAGRLPEDADRFHDLDVVTLQSGAPFLVGGLAWFDCQVQETHPMSTHDLFIGRVLVARSFDGKPPLLYFNRDYRSLT